MKRISFLNIILCIFLVVCGITAAGCTEQPSISLDKAKKIALSTAGLVGTHMTFTREDYNSDQKKYELVFHSNKIEYEIDIDANYGQVLKYEKHDVLY